VFCDPEFEGLMGNLTHHDATDAVFEAIKMVQTAPEPATEEEKLLDLSPEVHIHSICHPMLCLHSR